MSESKRLELKLRAEKLIAMGSELDELLAELEKNERERLASAEQALDIHIASIEERIVKLKAAQEREAASTIRQGTERREKVKKWHTKLSRVATELLAKIEENNISSAREVERLKKKIAELESKAPRGSAVAEAAPLVARADPRATTLAIYDSIIFAISSWSTEGDTAPDFELACQATLFPTIYTRVMKGEDDYYIEEVPSSALEVVKRGREYVKMLRSTQMASLIDPDVWNEFAPMVHEWWINDGLPLLYGARSDDWDSDEPLSLFAIQEWKQQPASRALNFPLIFDGMELVEKHRDQIRETSGLPAFNKQTLQTRLQP